MGAADMTDPVLACPNCGASSADGHLFGRTAGTGLVGRPATEDIVCVSCWHRWSVPYALDHHVLATNREERWAAMSDHAEQGRSPVKVGTDLTVYFTRPFAVVGQVNTQVWLYVETPHGRVGGGLSPSPIDAWALRLPDGSGLVLTASRTGIPSILTLSGVKVTTEGELDAEVHWTVYGLADPAALPTWHLLFYSAMRLTEDRLWKPALLEYEAAFEAYVADHLTEVLTRRFDSVTAKALLRQQRIISTRVNTFMLLSAGYRLQDAPGGLLRQWTEKVQDVRNRIAHGSREEITSAQVEEAHQIVYRAISWLRDQLAQR